MEQSAITLRGDYSGLLTLMIGLLFATFTVHLFYQWSSDTKVKVETKQLESTLEQLQSSMKDSAKRAKEQREADHEYYNEQIAKQNSRHNARINVLEIDISALNKDCESLREGRLNLQRELSSSKVVIEELRGELLSNAVKHTAIVDTLNLELDALRKQLKEQKKQHDMAMTDLQSRYEEVIAKTTTRFPGNVGILTVRNAVERVDTTFNELLSRDVLHVSRAPESTDDKTDSDDKTVASSE